MKADTASLILFLAKTKNLTERQRAAMATFIINRVSLQ